VKDSELKIKKTFTLIEVLVVLAVFSFVIMGATRALISVQNAWAKQKQRIGLIQDSRWISEKLGLELRHGADDTGKGKLQVQAGDGRLVFGFDFDRDRDYDNDDQRIWYWVGTGHGAHGGDPGKLYKGIGQGLGNTHGDPEAVAVGICETDEENDDYSRFDEEDDGLVRLTFILRPHPLEEDAPGNRSFHFLTKIRARNSH